MTTQVDLGIWQRPNFQFRSLPLDIRWEVTRRHPVYQAFWRPFELDGLPDAVHTHMEAVLDNLGDYLLSAINVGGARPNPNCEFEELGSEYWEQGWQSGAVHPFTNRQLAALLIATLPDEALGHVGLAMINAAHGKPVNGESCKHHELRKLQTLDFEGLDAFVNEPIVAINPAASSRDINESMNSLVKSWKEERGLSERRTPVSKLRSYLEVWDSREGWYEGAYDRTRETTLREIANQRGVSVKTIHNQYRSAFKLITGHEYSVDHWVELFGTLKLSDLFGGIGTAGRLRPLIEKTRRAVPESVLGSSEIPSLLRTVPGNENESVMRILLDNIKRLIAEGENDEEIAKQLSLEHPDWLPPLRQRIEDGIL